MIHCCISFSTHLAVILACFYSCLASGVDVFCIRPNGVVAEKMELDISGALDDDKGFDENMSVKRKTWCKEDIVIPQTDLKCGKYLFIREKRKKSRWLLIDKEGNMLGYAEMYLFKTELEARKLLKNSFSSPTRLTLKNIWGKNGTCCVFRDMKEFPETLLYATRGNLGLSVRGPHEREVWDVKLAEAVLDFFLDRSTWVPVDEKEVAAAWERRK